MKKLDFKYSNALRDSFSFAVPWQSFIETLKLKISPKRDTESDSKVKNLDEKFEFTQFVEIKKIEITFNPMPEIDYICCEVGDSFTATAMVPYNKQDKCEILTAIRTNKLQLRFYKQVNAEFESKTCSGKVTISYDITYGDISEISLFLEDAPLIDVAFPRHIKEYTVALPISVLNGYLKDKYSENQKTLLEDYNIQLDVVANSEGNLNLSTESLSCVYEIFSPEDKKVDLTKGWFDNLKKPPAYLCHKESDQTKDHWEEISNKYQIKDIEIWQELKAKNIACEGSLNTGYDLLLFNNNTGKKVKIVVNIKDSLKEIRFASIQSLRFPKIEVFQKGKLLNVEVKHENVDCVIRFLGPLDAGQISLEIASGNYRLPMDVFGNSQMSEVKFGENDWNPLGAKHRYLPKEFRMRSYSSTLKLDKTQYHINDQIDLAQLKKLSIENLQGFITLYNHYTKWKWTPK